MPQPDAKARAILNRISYATLASADVSGQPWNTPVYCAYDEAYNVYWGSHVGSQHSQNILANDKVFVVVYDSTAAPGTGAGVYIQARAHELTDPKEIAAAHKFIQDRRQIPYWKLEEAQPDRPVRLFKATPEHVWRNNGGQKDGQYIDVREAAEAEDLPEQS